VLHFMNTAAQFENKIALQAFMKNGMTDSTIKNFRARMTPRRSALLPLAAFLLPAAIFILYYAIQGVSPFGNMNLVTVDLRAQYIPFLAELREKILSGESLFYSWRGALGSNFYATWAYYLVSPFNVLVLLFPVHKLADCSFIIIALKIGMAGLSFQTMLRRVFRTQHPLSVAFATSYALSNFVIAYSWNLMWMDGLILLPFVIGGLIHFIREKKPLPYLAALTLALVINYYTAYFIGVFTALFLGIAIAQFDKGSLRENLKTAGKVFFFSVAALFLAAFILLPVVFGLYDSYASLYQMPPTTFFKENAWATFLQPCLMQRPHVFYGSPNIYCGLLPLLLIPVFLRKAPLKRGIRLAYIGLIAFLFASFLIRPLDYFWHGFHHPTGMEYRYAFLFVFLMLFTAWQALPSLHEMKRIPLFLIASLCVVASALPVIVNQKSSDWIRVLLTLPFIAGYLYLCSMKRESDDMQDKKQPSSPHIDEKQPSPSLSFEEQFSHRRLQNKQKSTLNIKKPQLHSDFKERFRLRQLQDKQKSPLLRIKRPHRHSDTEDKNKAPSPLLAQYGRSHGIQRKRSLFLFLLIVAELAVNLYFSSGMMHQGHPLTPEHAFLENPVFAAQQTLVKHAASLSETNNIRLYTFNKLNDNDAKLLNHSGVSIFDSNARAASVFGLGNLGYVVNGYGNAITSPHAGPLMNTWLGIQYGIVPDHWQIEAPETQTITSAGQEILVKHDTQLSFGFFIEDKDALHDPKMPRWQNPLDAQNQLALDLLDGDVVYSHAPPALNESIDKETFTVTPTSDRSFYYSIKKTGTPITWRYTIPEEGRYLIYWQGNLSNVHIDIPSRENHLSTPNTRQLVDLGELRAGESVDLTFTVPFDQSEGSFMLQLSQMDRTIYNTLKKQWSDRAFRLTSWKNDTFTGVITAPGDGYVFLPMSAVTGWTFTANEEPISPIKINDTFYAVPVKQGHVTIHAAFLPPGFKIGLTISLLTFTTLLMIYVMLMIRRKRRQRHHQS
jgi:uncharacterized membrane protein YfhO